MKTEQKNLLLVDSCLILISVAAAFFAGMEAAFSMLFAAAVLSAFYLWEIHRREIKISKLCDMLDRMLYRDEPWQLQDYRDGELAILQDKVQKLTIRLREQAELLRKEKGFQEQMIADISHQLKTPLTAMSLIISRLCREEMSENERMKKLIELQQLADRVDTLVVILLKLAKLDSGTAVFRCEPVPIAQLVRHSIKPLEISMDLHAITLCLSGGETDCFTGDFDWTGEAMTNLFKNGIEHMEDGGTLYVSWRETPVYSEIVVEDEGCGIPPDELGHIFERFYRGEKARHSGFGIGMSFAQSVIRKQNGTIRAENRKEGGARFLIRFQK